MKKLTTTLLTFLSVTITLAQVQNKKIVKITYKSVPVSQYCVSKKDAAETRTLNRGTTLDLLNGHRSYYTLLINLIDRNSIFIQDSVRISTIKGIEDMNASNAEDLIYSFNPVGNKTFKLENFLGQMFYTEGTTGDIEWELTDERKQIVGLECKKAVSKNRDLRLTAWYTNALPISSGPSIYLGLPGLVVWVEDFYRTTQIEKIEYSNSTVNFEAKLKKLQSEFEAVKKSKITKEKTLIMDKVMFANKAYKQIHIGE